MENNWDAVKEFVEKSMKQWKVPGVAVGILHHGETFTGGLGVTSIENPLPVTDDTIFQTQSISKTFTGTVIMQLVEQGKIRLDAPVREYLPEFKVADEEASATVTVRHLLTHTEGWDGDVRGRTGNGDDAYPRFTALLADREQFASPGEIWAYNNSGFRVAGHIVEKVTGKLFEQVMQELVFDPLGMERSFMNALDVMTYRFAVGHFTDKVAPEMVRRWGGGERGGGSVGGVLSTAQDMLKYARFHLGDGQTADGKRLLTPESMNLLHSPQLYFRGKLGWGISFEVNDSYGVRQFGHGGNGSGQNALLTMVPEHDFAIVVLTNGSPAGTQVTLQGTRFAIHRYLGIEMKDPEVIPATEEELEEFVGKYVKPDSDIEVRLEDGQLILEVHLPDPPPIPPMTLGFLGGDMTKVIDGDYKDMIVDLVRKADGSVGWLRTGRVYTKV